MKLFNVLMDTAGDGTGGAAAGGAAAGGAAAGGAAAGQPWYSGFKDPAVREWVGSYKDAYPDAESIALKALNLERFVTADKAGRGIVVPATDKPEEWMPIWKRLGAPEKPEGYKVPQGAEKDPFTLELRAHAHKIGMPSVFFDGMLGFLSEKGKAQAQAQVAEFEQKSEAEYNQVKQEWGAQFDSKVELGRRAAAAIIPHKSKDELESVLNKIEGALGTKFTMNMWSKIGGGMGEHQFVGGEGDGGQGGITAESARMQIAALKKDAEWGKKFTAGDAEARALWSKLHKIGFPEQKGEDAQYVM